MSQTAKRPNLPHIFRTLTKDLSTNPVSRFCTCWEPPNGRYLVTYMLRRREHQIPCAHVQDSTSCATGLRPLLSGLITHPSEIPILCGSKEQLGNNMLTVQLLTRPSLIFKVFAVLTTINLHRVLIIPISVLIFYNYLRRDGLSVYCGPDSRYTPHDPYRLFAPPKKTVQWLLHPRLRKRRLVNLHCYPLTPL